jgi:hypothetical protein
MSDSIELGELEAHLAAARTEAAKAEEAHEAAETKFRELNQELYRRIQGGETIDRITDLVIKRNHGLNPEAVELFRSVEERVAAHVGEPVVVVFRKVEYATHVFGRGNQDPYITTSTGVGILNKPELIISEGDWQWSFPTDSHAINDPSHPPNPRLITGPLTTSLGTMHLAPLEGYLDTPISHDPKPPSFGRTPPGHLEIAIGTAEAEELMQTWDLHNEPYGEMLDMLLQFPTPESTETQPGPVG